MTNTKHSSAPIVTPHKVYRDRKAQARLLNRSLGVVPSDGPCFRTMTQQRQPLEPRPRSMIVHQERQMLSSSNKPRVFRCLSNTSRHSYSSPVSPERSRAQAQRSALKSMFQPPASPPSRNVKRSSKQQQEREASSRENTAFFGSKLDKSTLTRQPLRRSHHRNSTRSDSASPSVAAKNTNAEKTTSRKVHFQPSVTVVSIPSHREYSSATKKTLWGSMKEIKANAIRNTAEFIHDKCNWRNAAEEDRMYRDNRNGTLIHPVHVERYYAAMQAQQEKKKKQQEEQAKKEQDETSENREERVSKGNPPLDQRKEEIAPASRKRVRCCSPSPIRRSRPANSPDYERHEPKRPRLHVHTPLPRCRHPMYYQAPHPMYGPPPPHPMQQQENTYVYYEHHPPHPHAMAMMHPFPFPHHPNRGYEIA